MKLRQIFIPVITLATVGFNIFVEQIVPRSTSVAEVSDKYFTNVTPYGLTFIIWGVIFIGLLGYSFYQSLPKNKDKAFLDEVAIWYAMSCIANIMWLVLWTLELIVATPVVMLVLLGSLVVSYISLHLNIPPDDEFTWQDRLFVYLPFSIYLGWISVATIANIASFLDSFGITDLVLDGRMWAAILMVVAAILAGALLIFAQDLPFAVTVLWGLFGIFNNGDNISPQLGPIQIAFLAALMIIAGCGSYAIFTWYRKYSEEHAEYF